MSQDRPAGDTDKAGHPPPAPIQANSAGSTKPAAGEAPRAHLQQEDKVSPWQDEPLRVSAHLVAAAPDVLPGCMCSGTGAHGERREGAGPASASGEE